ncbi:MAG: S9 family peptidase, partial [Gammaproteobacteria bacterium]
AENALTRRYLDRLPQRDWFAQRLASLIDYERRGVPVKRGGVYLFEYNSGRLEQDQLRLSRDPRELGEVIIDPNALAADGSISVPLWSLSPDGRWLAWAQSVGGSDWDSWRIRDLTSGEDLPEVIEGTKFTSVAWLPDASGFFYSQYPFVEGRWDDTRQVRVRWHRLGSDPAEDPVIFEVTDHPTRNPYATVTEDGQFLVYSLFDGYETSGVYYQRLDGATPVGPVQRLLDAWDARYEFVGNDGERFIVQTTRDAPRGRVIAIDLAKPDPADWQKLVPEAAEAIESVALLGGRLYVQSIRDAHALVRLFALDGRPLGELPLPGIGSVGNFSGRADDPEVLFGYTDFTTPWTIYRHHATSGDIELLFRPETGLDPDAFRSRQVFYTSRDGTRVPMTVITPVDREAGQPGPLVLYGYGGFNVSLLPSYSTARAAWLQAGGGYAVANLRGGGEYGEAWHQAGTKLNKQNVFDDFIAAAEWLQGNGYASREQLAIWGGSNGGLLVAAVANQRPELFAAVVPAVGVLDMLRYHTASANARQWSSDYGLAENEAEFRALYAYSPYHNLKPGECYPPTLVMADANDDRVAPWHSYKYAAALQYAQGCKHPVLIRIETNTGHGAGASTSKIINEYADQWAFVAEHTGLELP